MSQLGVPDPNDNVLEGNKLAGLSNRERKRGSSTHKRALDG